MKKLLVGSVFANDSPLQQQWLDLQLRYLRATTPDFEHVVILMAGVTNDSFISRTKVIEPGDKSLGASDAHLRGLNILLDLFKARTSDFENFLFIDGDAFPFRKDWMSSLLYRMKPHDRFEAGGIAMPIKQAGRDYEIAIALRSENLEQRLHASIVFVKGQFLEHVNFADALVGDDLAGNPEGDIHLPNYQWERRRMAFPLIRSNQYNLHPLACGIYYDMFYHHCCGSGRWFNLRAKEYYNRVIQPRDDLTPYTKQLMESPAEFIGKLAGWNPSRYADV
jgi:hypothetical protein